MNDDMKKFFEQMIKTRISLAQDWLEQYTKSKNESELDIAGLWLAADNLNEAAILSKLIDAKKTKKEKPQNEKTSLEMDA